MRAFLLPLALSIALALPPTTAWADGDAPAAPVGADIVKTYDGHVLRGTIIERDPTGSVSIQLVTGAVRSVPMKDVAWGRLSREEIGRLLEFHSIKFEYEARTPYTAARAASPLASRMLEAMQHGPKLTVLVGHDTNIANLGGFLDLHWTLPDYPRDDPPPGGALGFEVLADPAGKQYVRAFYRAQTMDQVRELQALDGDNKPAYVYLEIPGCAEPCALADFAAQVGKELVASVPRDKQPATDSVEKPVK